MARVGLVYPYFRTKSLTEMLFPPLGIAGLEGQLRRLGIETRIFDGTFMTLKQVHQAVCSYQPDIVGIYSMVTLSQNTFRLAEMIRKSLPNGLLVAGGPLPTLYPDRYLNHFDAVFRGESEFSFPQFCQDYLQENISRQKLGELALDMYPGLCIHNQDLQVDNPMIHHSEKEIKTFALPDRSDFNHIAYQKAWLKKDHSKTTSIMTTLGCPFDCDFCSKPIFGSVFRRRNLDAVFTEVEQIRNLGYDSLWIADDNFTLNRSFLENFCQRMVGRHIGWSCLSRCAGIDAGIAQQMKEGGCQRVYLGLESGCKTTLQLMNKKVTLEEGMNAVHLFHNAGIEVGAFFIVGYPGETSASIEETFKFALSLPLDNISFNVPFPLPGTKLYERVSHVNASQDWNAENEVTFIYESEFDPDWLQRRISQTLNAHKERKE